MLSSEISCHRIIYPDVICISPAAVGESEDAGPRGRDGTYLVLHHALSVEAVVLVLARIIQRHAS